VKFLTVENERSDRTATRSGLKHDDGVHTCRHLEFGSAAVASPGVVAEPHR
jgi:hypothetical protein